MDTGQDGQDGCKDDIQGEQCHGNKRKGRKLDKDNIGQGGQ